MIWLEVTPWSVLPVALPPWQTLVRLPKVAPAAAGADCEAGADVDEDAGVVPVLELLEPARLQPAAMSVTAATAVIARTVGLTGFVPFLLAQTSRLGDAPRLVLLGRK
jgi:hypothetical protein